MTDQEHNEMMSEAPMAEPADIPPPEDHLPTCVINAKHDDICEDFLAKIKGILEVNKLKIMDYGVKRARSSWETNDEFATLSLLDGSGRTLIIKLETKEEK